MPRLSAWFVRASLLYLVGGFALGALMLAEKGIPFAPSIWAVFPIHVEFLLVGWLIQLALGVAFWILPRFGKGAPRGSEKAILTSLALLNGGILLYSTQLWLAWMAPAGRVVELAAVMIYIRASWRRIKPMVVEPEGPPLRR